jgi:hypothetical protein
LFLLNFRFKADPFKPKALLKAHFGHFFKLTIIEFAENRSFNLVDILNFCCLGLFLDLKPLEQGCMSSSLTVLA